MLAKSRLRLLSLENRIAPAGFAVNSLADSGAGSLRAAITSANGSAGADTITFALPGSGGTISLLSALPAITEALTIDGTTQSGYVGVPRVTIDGTSAGAGVDGLNFSAGASKVKGLALVGFSGVAIHGNNGTLTIQSNYVGILADGKTAKGNGVGIRLEFNDNSVIGAASTGLGNLVSGNGTGIVLHAWNCTVRGNRIGTDVTGTVAVPNATGLLDLGLNNIIGGSNGGEGNLISGNTSVGLNMQTAGFSTVQGNRIGTDVTGAVALGNAIGISVGKASLTENYGSFVIGGANAGNANTIAFNGTGIVLLGGARDVGIIGNSIFQNSALGIDLSGAGSPDGPSLNGGAGANNMIRPPVLTSVTTSGATSTITGTLTGNANQRYRLEFFSNTSANASGYGEGKTFLGSLNITTNGSGQASFSTSVGAVSTNSFVAATATMTNVGDDLTTNATPTSEFSRAVRQSNAIFATAAGPGGGPHVVARNADGSIRFQMYAYAATYTGGVRVATGDVNGDGVEDLITAPGVGGGPHIRIFDGKNGQVIGEFFAYAANFTKGVFVAAGDIDGDGTAEIITGAGAGGGPHVRVFSLNGTLVREFFAYSASFLGGVNVASGDVNGDGKSDIITGVGPGGGPHVRVFSGLDNSVLTEFFAYSASFTGGVNVAAGDFNGDGKADIIVGAGSGGGPHVRVLSGANLSELASFFAYSSSFTGGVRVAADDLNGDGFADLITAPGPGIASQIKVLQGTSLNTLQSFNAYDPSFLGGVFVG